MVSLDQSVPRLAFVSILLLCIAAVAASLYVVLLVHWAPYSVFLPLAGTVLIFGGTLGRREWLAAWVGDALLILSGALHLLSIGLPFLVLGLVLALALGLLAYLDARPRPLSSLEPGTRMPLTQDQESVLWRIVSAGAIVLGLAMVIYVYYSVPSFGALPLAAIGVFLAGICRRDGFVALVGLVTLAAFGITG